MKLIKNILFSLALICSCSLLPSAPAPAQAIQDVDVPEFSQEEYQNDIILRMASINKICQRYPHIKELHESMNQCVQHDIDAQQIIKRFLKRQSEGANKAELNLLRNQVDEINKNKSSLFEQVTLKLNYLSVQQPKIALSLFADLRGLYFDKAGYLQGIVNTQATQIQQQAAHIAALQAALNQFQNPAEQQIAALPAAPGGVQIKKRKLA